MQKNSSLVFGMILCFSFGARAQSLSIETVLETTRKFFPQILEQQQKTAAARSEITETRGSFDTKLKSEFSGDMSGYYDGMQTKTYLESQLPIASNMDVFAGYKKSFGNFPVYEGFYQTLDQGEFFAGIRFDLLRNFGLDEARLKVFLADLKYEIEKNKLHFQTLKVQEEAAKAYWDWVANGFILKTYANLYQISLDRDQAIQKRIQRGDLAGIFGIENQQNVLQRRSDLQNAQQIFDNSAQVLSLYLRDSSGEQIIPNAAQLPAAFDAKIPTRPISNAAIFIQQRPEVITLGFEQRMIRDQLRFSKSQTLPSLGLLSQFKKDYGDGPDMYRGNESEVMLNFEFPLQNRKGRGQTAKFESLDRAIEFEKKLLIDQIEAKFNQTTNTLSVTQDILRNLEQEVVLAEKLQEAEVQRWQNGDSDFFLINLREQTTARSRIQWIKTGLLLQKAFAEYSNLTLAYPSLTIPTE